MKHLLRFSGFAFCVLVFFPVALFGQDAAPSMTVVLSNTDRLKDDLKLMLDLTTPAEQKQWKTVEEYLDQVFLLGLDGTRLHRYDLISGAEGVEYRSSFPIADQQDFIENLELFGIDVRRRGRTLYSLSGAFEGIMRIIDDYGVIGQRKDVPIRGFEPIDDTMKKYVLKPDGETPIYDLMFLLLNQNDNVKARHASYADVKKELMAAVKQAEDETKEDFELRRALTELQIDELGRYYTDPKELVVGWTLNNAEKKGSGAIDLLPDADTPLAEAVARLAQVPSRYEAIPEPEGKILSGRLNLPLDQQQQGNLVEVVELLADRGKSEVEASKTLKTDEQKAAMKQVITLLSDSAIGTVKSGRFDGFAQARPAQNGKYTLLGGAQLDNAQNISEALKQLQIARPDRTIALDVAEHEGLAIHEIQVSPEDEPKYDDLYGSKTFHIAVGEKEFWYAVGTDSLDALKAAVAAANEKADVKPNEEFFSFYFKAGPWIEWRDRHAEPSEPAKIETVVPEEDGQAGDEKKIKVDREQLRKKAIEAFEPGDDVWTMSLKREEDRVKGAMSVDTGILRLVGKLIAQFSEETLEE